MLFSAEWLGRYVALPDSIEELAEVLTRCGMVVEDQRRHGDDTVFDLDIPSNRVDAMNHLGVAREIATALRVPLQIPDELAPDGDTAVADLSSVTIDDLEGCPRYAARLVQGVRIAPSPPWLVSLLDAIGLRSLNNVADITNFVMWEFGHPLHAFDFDKLAEGRIVVRRARDGETLVTLDDIDRKLVATDVVIADAENPVALGGIMGGAGTAISDTTTNVLLEGAWFDPAAVRATAQRLNLHTDASHRFERSPAHDGMLAALDRAAALVVELAGGTAAAGTIDVVGVTPEAASTTLRNGRLEGLLGIDVASADVEDILQRLGFGVRAADEGLVIDIPSSRPDVRLEEDLVEEIGRHVGYDRLPATLPIIEASDAPGTDEVLGEQRLKRVMAAAGCQEAMSSSLSAPVEQALFLDEGQELVTLGNPISESLSVLRAHVTPGLLTAVAHNVNHGRDSVHLFEVGRCFSGPVTDDGISERWGLGIVLTGLRRATHWDSDADVVDFFDLKGVIEAATHHMAWPAWSWSPGEHAGIAPGTAAVLSSSDPEAQCGGWAGKLAPDAASALGIDVDVWMAELDIDVLLARPHPTANYTPESRFPGGARDIALDVPRELPYASIEEVARRAADSGALPLVDVALIEIYEGDKVAADRRSLTIRLLFRAADRTLTADEIDAAQAQILAALAADCGASQR